MAIKQPLFLENLDYSATDVRRLITSIYPRPGCIEDGDLKVSQHAGTPNRSVDVAAGSAVIAGTDVAEQGNYLFTSDAVTNVLLDAAPGAGQSRIDLIVAQILDQDADGGGSNLGEIVFVKGTAAATGSEVAPSLPASCLLLADVLVGPSVTVITNGDITEERVYATLRSSFASGNVSSVSLSGSGATVVLTTASLAVGTWLINFTGFGPIVATGQVALTVAEGTATATFAGGTECTVGTSGTGFTASLQPFALSFEAVVTEAGTVEVSATASGSGNTMDWAGYTALRVA